MHLTQTPAHHHSVFTGQMLFLLPNQKRQSTEDRKTRQDNIYTYNSTASYTPGKALQTTLCCSQLAVAMHFVFTS